MKKSWEQGQEESEYWSPRTKWNLDLTAKIRSSAWAHPTNTSCEIVQNEVLEYFKFDTAPLLSLLNGNRAGIEKKIEALEGLCVSDPDHCQELTPEEAQEAANRSDGSYIVLALMWANLSSGIGKHHAAFIVGGQFSPLNGSAVAGGGMKPEFLNRGWEVSTGSIHFSEWKKARYFYYGFKKGVK